MGDEKISVNALRSLCSECRYRWSISDKSVGHVLMIWVKVSKRLHEGWKLEVVDMAMLNSIKFGWKAYGEVKASTH